MQSEMQGESAEQRTMGTLVKDARGRSKFWYYCYRDASGRRLKKSTKETDRRKARIIGEGFEDAEDLAKRGNATEEQIRKVMNDTLARVTGKRVYDPTVREWLDEWLANEKGAVSDATLTRYRQVVADFLDGLGPIANQRVEAVTSEHVLKHRQQLESEGRAPATVNFTVKRVLKRVFKVAMDDGVIARNPCATVRLIQDRDKAAKHVFLPQQVSKLVETAEGDWKGLIITAYYTGGRLSDLARLTWSNVDLSQDNKVIRFMQKKTKGKTPKSKVEIPIHEALQECLFSGTISDTPNAPVFPELYNKPGSGKSGLSMAFKRLMAKAGIDDGKIRERNGAAGRSVSALSFHSLRHSFNSALANAGVSQELRQKLTGHASADMNTVYTHHDLETIRTAVQTLPRLPKVTSKI
jgi:integrase